MRLIFAGSPACALPTLQDLSSGPHQVVGVITRPPAPAGRGRHLRPSAVGEMIDQLRSAPIPGGNPPFEVLEASSLRGEDTITRFAAWGADLGVIVAYGALLPPRVLEIPRYGWINVHFSLLPRWRGAAPVQRAIEAGDKVTGITIFQLEAGLDTGPIWCQTSHQIEDADTSGELLDRLASHAPALVSAAISQIEAGGAPRPQESEGITMAPRLDAAAGCLDWHRPAQQLINQVRAYSPSPGAWSLDHRGSRLRIHQLAPADDSAPRLEPGRLAATKATVWVGTGTQPVSLGLVSPAGKPAMEAPSWARGARLEADSTLGGNP